VLPKSLASAGPSIHEVLDEGVLHWLAGRDVVPCNTALIGPGQDGDAGELAAVVAERRPKRWPSRTIDLSGIEDYSLILAENPRAETFVDNVALVSAIGPSTRR
jgi:hypothetical protein